MRVAEGKWELLAGRFFARLAAELPRHALLQDLHDRGRSSLRRLADEQMNVVGHDYVTRQREPIAIADLTQNFDKQSLGGGRGKQG